MLHNTVTAGLVDRVDDRDQLATFGASVDVCSYGAALYETLAGEQHAVACTGAGLLHCLMEKVETRPYPCSDAGQAAAVPEYLSEHSWKVLFEAAQSLSIRRTPWGQGKDRDVVGEFLQ